MRALAYMIVAAIGGYIIGGTLAFAYIVHQLRIFEEED